MDNVPYYYNKYFRKTFTAALHKEQQALDDNMIHMIN